MLNSAEHEILNAHKYKKSQEIQHFLGSDKLLMLFFMFIMLKCQCVCMAWREWYGIISIFHVCMVWIVKSVTRVTDRHHEASRVMPNSDLE